MHRRTLSRLLPHALVCGLLAILQYTIPSAPARASTFADETIKCPVGGERFKYMALMSISTWGALPDGMPLGSGRFPITPPQCPANGLVLYRKFTPPEVAKLAMLVASAEYKAWRAAGDTPFYLAYQTARYLGDQGEHRLLLSATWEAKNDDAAGERAKRYNEEFVAAVNRLPPDPANIEYIAARLRAANALRELGRFDEAEAMRAATPIAPTAGGADSGADQNRAGWAKFSTRLAAVIARHDSGREPIDMLGDREAARICLTSEAARQSQRPAPAPLTGFEATYCASPELAEEIALQRQGLMNPQR